MESELKGWTNLDNYLEILENLDDNQIKKECDSLYSIHRTKTMGCPYDHPQGSICFVGRILEAVEEILNLYDETKYLPANNRYILCYYLSLCQDGQICELVDL